MEFTLENQGSTTYLVYRLKTEDNLDSVVQGMITNNKIPGFAPAIITRQDSGEFIKYNVSEMRCAKQLFSGQVNKKLLVGVLQGIVKAILSAEEYLINPNMILWDLERIYVDVYTYETVVLCLPIEMEDAAYKDLGMFFKSIIISTQFDLTEDCGYLGYIISYLNSMPVFSAKGFNKLLGKLSEATINQPEITRNTATQDEETEKQDATTRKDEDVKKQDEGLPKKDEDIKKPKAELPKKPKTFFGGSKETSSGGKKRGFLIPGEEDEQEQQIPVEDEAPDQKDAPIESHKHFGETVDLENIGKTSVLSQKDDPVAHPYLLRMKTEEKIFVKKSEFRIGRNNKSVDYSVDDNSNVSQYHARIILEDGKYFVMDMNSTNHTYVNGGQIRSKEQIKLEDGTEIKFANEKFEFRLY